MTLNHESDILDNIVVAIIYSPSTSQTNVPVDVNLDKVEVVIP
jgi:hypothetical protein